ncbi:MAG: cob(I)yrinic acid a,c-diamide adenosyltransferase [Candidatus Nezhaarchaeota archaeon]|nr:cob(I)yrinic acid a,c-diamide adenosyltransferase [Candidatus Nezhaarchaeota archaeon]MCX8142301.1 cob(I)yrinic acid a,c-diamide adenosyltransferase [Candidatus Nezhaarchaeota archaeon]MDW8050726.1 cob(I)yrinic acid a,c-diamide adenosyltransferase [Nitrososphaerota archaeon]
MKRGYIHLYTGDGEGKTLTAFGLALRAVGHGYKAIIIQFMKGRKDIGEYKIRERLQPEYEIYQFGRPTFISLEKPEPIDYELAKEGLEFAKEALKRRPRVLVLDEINLAAAIGLVEIEDVLKLLENIPEETVVVLTGRRAPRRFIDVADLVTEMKDIKHPYRQGIEARRGIEY